ncbi:glycosyltransferase [Planctomicrobium piriforme]|uniref:Glycosyltransferase involved in cell wall bisynthesis n=1 Tax=Planctomicrobium piriforme TaxID=1576369 RepID=A0A1I3K2N4_9PLAN|nr:glycosyltransferase [Planctomicrobium piriforme]SFI66733.1 Glycosyltransferase involved in cell wall bisynthesis [Planctomicrobium piriforme]
MKILMVTNVYTPQIGGVTRSVQQFSEEYRAQGHEVLVIAPEYETMPEGETGVLRIPAIPKFYLNVYPLPLPLTPAVLPEVRKFGPQIVHVHHPFLLGSTGQLIAADLNVPLVYTHHTRYSYYIETKTNWPRPIEEGIVELITGFCELCDGVVSPSAGITEMLQSRGVTTRIEVIPTGVDVNRFAKADGSALRKRLQLPDDAFIVGHVGRLGPEKNCDFLCEAVREFLNKNSKAIFVVVGDGPERAALEQSFGDELGGRVHFLGFCEGDDLINAYAGFDVFAFASHSETQGMVLGEAMAAGTPVVAVKGTGVIDIVHDGQNGRMIPEDDVSAFVAALESMAAASPQQRQAWREAALKTAHEFSQERCAKKMLDFYADLIRHPRPRVTSDWERLQRNWDAGWQRWRNRANAIAAAVQESLRTTPSDETETAPATPGV